MTTNLKTQELIDAAITHMKAASFSFAVNTWQDGKLAHYAENLPGDLPAILVHEVDPIQLDIGGELGLSDIGGNDVGHLTDLRIVLVKQWADTEEMPTVRRADIQEVAQAFIGASAYGLDMGASIAGLDLHYAIPTSIETEPPEQEAIPEADHTYTAAVTVRIRSRSARS